MGSYVRRAPPYHMYQLEGRLSVCYFVLKFGTGIDYLLSKIIDLNRFLYLLRYVSVLVFGSHFILHFITMIWLHVMTFM